MFVEYFEPAHKHRRGCAPWTSVVLPAWPHLSILPNKEQRYDWVQAGSVEAVHLIAPDANDDSKVYVVRNDDRALWHERCVLWTCIHLNVHTKRYLIMCVLCV